MEMLLKLNELKSALPVMPPDLVDVCAFIAQAEQGEPTEPGEDLDAETDLEQDLKTSLSLLDQVLGILNGVYQAFNDAGMNSKVDDDLILQMASLYADVGCFLAEFESSEDENEINLD